MSNEWTNLNLNRNDHEWMIVEGVSAIKFSYRDKEKEKTEKIFPIEKGTVVLCRDYDDEKWSLDVLRNADCEDKYFFICERYIWCKIAPYSGNESAFNTENDISDLWDRDRLIKEGFIS